MIDFERLFSDEETKYWCIVVKETGEVLSLPFKRDFEKQTYEVLPFTQRNLDKSSYWVEGVANRLLRKVCRDNGLNWEDYAIYEYGDNTFK